MMTALSIIPFHPADADDRDDAIESLRKQVQELDQKLKVLERKREIDQEETSRKKKETPKLTVGEKGFSLTSADEAFQLRFRGVLQTDARTFIDEGATQGNDQFLLRRARPILEGRAFKDLTFLFVPDFGGSSVVIQDALLNYRFAPWLQLQAGKFKSPVGLEELQSDPVTLFNERALPNNLVPNRDIGFQLQGNAWDGTLTYAAGVFDGVGDGRSIATTDLDDEREFAGRLFALPFKPTEIDPLRSLGVGVGGTFGDQEKTGANALPSGYLTDGQQTFFSYRSGSGTTASPNIIAAGKHWRLSPQGYWFWGPYGLLAEYALSSQQVGRVTTGTVSRQTFQNTAWQVAGAWVLTGEDAAYTGVKPRKNFDLKAGTWGAFQLVGRYAELAIDDTAFPLYANPSSATDAAAWGVGLNWYLNPSLRIGVDYIQTQFDGGDGTSVVVREGEQVVLSRIQLAF